MKCQHCNNHEAENHFVVNWLGVEHNIHLCDECKTKLTKYYMANMAGQYRQEFSGNRRAIGESPFPADAGETIRQRRKLNLLKGRLGEAIESEQYEVAARLRDEIRSMEEEVVV